MRLPPAVLPVKETLNVLANVQLVGQTQATEGHTAGEGDVTKLLLEPGARFEIQGQDARFSNLFVAVSRTTKQAVPVVSVFPGASLEIVECVLDTEQGIAHDVLGFLVQGNLSVHGSLLTNWRVELEKDAVGQFVSTHLTKSLTLENKASCALSVFSQTGKQVFEKCEITNYSTGIQIESAMGGSLVDIKDCKFNCHSKAIVMGSGTATISGSSFSAPEGSAIEVSGEKSVLTVSKCRFEDCLLALLATRKSQSTIETSSILMVKSCAVRASTGAKVDLTEVTISTNATERINGIEVVSGAKVQCKKTIIQDLTGSAVICREAASQFLFEDLEMQRCATGGIFVSENGRIMGEILKCEENSGPSLSISDLGTSCSVLDMKVNGGDVGVLARGTENCTLTKLRCTNMKDTAVDILDASMQVTDTTINNKTTKAVGIYVKFKNSSNGRVHLRDCKVQNCEQGIKVEQITNGPIGKVAQKSNEHQPFSFVTEDEIFNAEATGAEKCSKCDLDNCAFVQCQLGFVVDAAKATLKGCSFIMNKQHAIFIKNHTLKAGAALRKTSKLKIRWPNYVEPYIDNGIALSNDPQMLANVTYEKLSAVLQIMNRLCIFQHLRREFAKRETYSDQKTNTVRKKLKSF